MIQAILIGIGGFAGALTRYGVSGFLQELARQNGRMIFPYGTLAVNILGCLMLGLVNRLAEERFHISPEIRLAITIGFFGGLTTFSTFAFETFSLMSQGHWVRAAANFFLQNALGLFAVWAGYMAAGWTFGK